MTSASYATGSDSLTGGVGSATKPSAIPEPGVTLPTVSLPTAILFCASLALWGVATWLALVMEASAWVTVPMHALVTFTMFTVLHEAVHHAAGRLRWVNELLGRMSIPFVAAYASFGMFRFIHIEHHRNTNEDIRHDPDAWTGHGPWWQLPLRWLTIDAWYTAFYLSHRRHRPRAEYRETVAMFLLSLTALAVAAGTGYLWELAIVYLIPQRIGMAVLAWWFDWLPHHGLTETAAGNPYRATRMRVGLEWLMTPVMLYQNYHLVHHLHPSIPFYRYTQAWRRNLDSYLRQDVPIATAWGRTLPAAQYVRRYRRRQPPEADRFHPLRVVGLRRLTSDSVEIALEVPADRRQAFGFLPGQHLTLRRVIDGEELRRTYSICAPVGDQPLRIAVKRIPGGRMSGFLTSELRLGDVVDVLPPSGRYVLRPPAGQQEHYVGLAAGSGITPILSMIASVLAEEKESRFTLLYGNRERRSIMFAADLDRLARRYPERLRVVHVLSREDVSALADDGRSYRAGRLDRDQLAVLLSEDRDLIAATSWFLCGPQGMVDAARDLLHERQVSRERIKVELFHGAATGDNPAVEAVASRIEAVVDGRSLTVRGRKGETVLESLLRERAQAPYACMGGACGTCRAKLLRGRGVMDANYVLDDDEVDAGYVLTCQLRPTTEALEVDYDA